VMRKLNFFSKNWISTLPSITKRRNRPMLFPAYVPMELVPHSISLLIVDVYWENVGGETLDAVLLNANNFSRFVGCGMISSYAKSETYGVKNLMQIISKRIRFEGFIQGDLRHLYWDVFSLKINLTIGFLQGD